MAPLVAAAVLSATAAGAQVEPPKPARSFVAVLGYPGGSELVSWQAPEELAVRLATGRAMLGGTWAHGGRVVYRYAASSPVSALSGTFAARPDAPPLLDAVLGPRDFVLAQVRAGALKLGQAGRSAWRVKLFAPANKCAGFGSGFVELWLRRADLLPVRLLERHGTVTAREFSLRYRSVNRRVPAATFVAPRTSVAYRADKGFVRSSPAAAAAHLPYRPLLPRSLPAGFALGVSGWAARSAATGAEGSIAPARGLFAAVYLRGSEEIDLTERLAPPGGWPADPFGAECVRQFSERASIGAVRGVYAASVATTPHLYWRRGRLLYTLSGPFPKARLVEIAASLRPLR